MAFVREPRSAYLMCPWDSGSLILGLLCGRTAVPKTLRP